MGWRELFHSGPNAWSWTGKTVKGSLARLPAPERLALEMALHEDRERRAMEGELRLLEHQWRDAEAVAAIADGLLPPPGAERFIARHADPGRRGAAERPPTEDD